MLDNDLLYAAECQLVEVAKDAKTTKDPTYAKILSSTLTSILGWAEQRLLAYHDTFDNVNINSMQSIVSLGVSAAKILVEDISNEYRRRRKNDTDVARSRTDTYIRSSLRTAFAQMAGGSVAPTGVAKDRAEQYEGKVTAYAIIACIVAAVGGSIFGYDIGISCDFIFQIN
ncbi:putative protein unc-13 [Helianthus anomalus]